MTLSQHISRTDFDSVMTATFAAIQYQSPKGQVQPDSEKKSGIPGQFLLYQ